MVKFVDEVARHIRHVRYNILMSKKTAEFGNPLVLEMPHTPAVTVFSLFNVYLLPG
jgi:hypothetical protein